MTEENPPVVNAETGPTQRNNLLLHSSTSTQTTVYKETTTASYISANNSKPIANENPIAIQNKNSSYPKVKSMSTDKSMVSVREFNITTPIPTPLDTEPSENSEEKLLDQEKYNQMTTLTPTNTIHEGNVAKRIMMSSGNMSKERTLRAATSEMPRKPELHSLNALRKYKLRKRRIERKKRTV